MLEKMLTWSFLTALLTSGVRMATPLFYAGLGVMISEKSGVINIGMEGVMLCGAFFSFAAALYTGSVWAGVLAGMAGGMLISMLLALVCVRGKQNQTVCGLALNMLALGDRMAQGLGVSLLKTRLLALRADICRSASCRSCRSRA